MRKPFGVLLLFTAMILGIEAFAQVPSQSTPPAPAVRIRGTIDKYDASTRILALSTVNGTMRFPLASAARIRQGWQMVDASELTKLSGHRAVVRYSESGGNKTVESVHVLGREREEDR